MAEHIFHITSRAAWEGAVREGLYAPDSLATEGFIHCSNARQVIRIANLRFAGQHDLVLLRIDAQRLAEPIRYENLEGGEELFPHIYGAIPATAVISVTAFEPDQQGRFNLNAGVFDDDPRG